MNTPINIEIAEILFKKHGVLLSDINDVIMWLYEKHGIWVSVIDKNINQTEWELQISKKGMGLIFSSGQYPPKYYNLPTEAYEAAIKYVLTKLI